VILLYRDDVYNPESPRAGEIDLIVAKNRQGPLGTVTLSFRGHYAMCGEMYQPPGQEEAPERAA
jgi:replicative DNA helicase